MTGQPKDRLVHAYYEDGSLHLVGRRGEVEVAYPDGFYLTDDNAARLPSRWARHLRQVGNGYTFATWPERVRKGGSRRGRLGFFNNEDFKPNDVTVLEADIDPVRRFLAERKGLELADDWRVLYFDFETKKIANWSKPHETRVLSFSWKSSKGGKGHVRLKADDDRAEFELLDVLCRLLATHDIAVAWNGDRFDFPILRERAHLLGVPFDPRLVHFLDHLRVFRRYWLKSEDGAITSSFALDAVGDALLGMRKVPLEDRARALGFEKGDLYQWTWANAPDLHKEYVDQDVELMHAIEEKTGFIQLHLRVCHICKVLPGPQSLFPMTLVDGKMLQRGAEAGYHFPSRLRDEEEGGFVPVRGAYVPEAVVGLHESVAVLDYARMYVSIIRSFNMSLETLDPAGDIEVPVTTSTGARVPGGVIARFRSDPPGHLPVALGEIIDARTMYKALQKAAEVGSPEFHDYGRLSNACKVLGNIFYGVLLSVFSRYFVKEIGESILAIGRLLLANTIALVKRRGHRVVAGDTDAVDFVATDQEAEAAQAEVNEKMLPPLLAECGVKRSEVHVEFEKRYSLVVFTASKRYAGRWAVFDGKPAKPDAPPDVKGLEIVRSDVCRATRALQRAIVELVLGGAKTEEIGKFVESWKGDFLAAKTPVSELVVTKGLTQALAAYRGEPQHVKVAKQMVEEGIEVDAGAKIPFVLTEDGPVHPRKVGDLSKVDLATYWNDHVFEPTRRVLEAAFPDHPWVIYEVKTERKKSAAHRIAESTPDLFGHKRSLVLVLDEAFAAMDRLKALLGAFPGEHPVEVHVEVMSERKVVEMRLPDAVKVRRPEDDGRLAQGLRTLGVRWR